MNTAKEKLMWAEKAPHYNTIIEKLGQQSVYRTSVVIRALQELDLSIDYYQALLQKGWGGVRFLRVVSHPVFAHVN